MLEEEQVAENHRKGLPHNFSWLKPSRIAGTSAPRRMSEVEALVREGVSHLVIPDICHRRKRRCKIFLIGRKEVQILLF